MIVTHRSGAYAIDFCRFDDAIGALPEDSVIITDANVAAIYSSRLPPKMPVCIVPPGESSKCTDVWAKLLSELSQRHISRRSTAVALGGGVIGDLAGFVAATYMRGIDLIQIPTTLLAQVDSSVGGKVGIDLPEGKNLVGAFHPPSRVLICDETLDTLPQREFINGMAEAWKYGFILDEDLVGQMRRLSMSRSEIVGRCIEWKRRVVEADEFETLGERAKLNFGHTVGHAIEHLAGFGNMLHGEAISVGMVMEARLSEAMGLAAKGTSAIVEECLGSQGLPTTSVLLTNVDMLIETMRRDKKAASGRLAFSLLTRIGECRLVIDVPESEVRAVLSSQ